MISSYTSTDILGRLDNLQLDAGITYLDNEPLGRVSEVPLYRERYHLVTAADGPFRDRKSSRGRRRQACPCACCLATCRTDASSIRCLPRPGSISIRNWNRIRSS